MKSKNDANIIKLGAVGNVREYEKSKRRDRLRLIIPAWLCEKLNIKPGNHFEILEADESKIVFGIKRD